MKSVLTLGRSVKKYRKCGEHLASMACESVSHSAGGDVPHAQSLVPPGCQQVLLVCSEAHLQNGVQHALHIRTDTIMSWHALPTLADVYVAAKATNAGCILCTIIYLYSVLYIILYIVHYIILHCHASGVNGNGSCCCDVPCSGQCDECWLQ